MHYSHSERLRARFAIVNWMVIQGGNVLHHSRINIIIHLSLLIGMLSAAPALNKSLATDNDETQPQDNSGKEASEGVLKMEHKQKKMGHN